MGSKAALNTSFLLVGAFRLTVPTYCRWSDACHAEWERLEHLSLVAGMTRGQIDKLRKAGIASLGSLAQLPSDFAVPTLNPDTFARLACAATPSRTRRNPLLSSARMPW